MSKEYRITSYSCRSFEGSNLMKAIGIDENNYLIYEGSGTWGHPVWPTPAVLPAFIVDEYSDDISPKNVGYLGQPFIFIDDGYDPTSRVRKGRIYEKGDQQPMQWYVQMHPAIPGERDEVNDNGVLSKRLLSFRQFNFALGIERLGIDNPLIVLGKDKQFTIWSVIDIETSISGETILFLKARKTMGVLPRVNYGGIDKKYHNSIKDKINRLAEDIHKAGADSIVDRCREAASAVVNAYLLENGHIDRPKDLGQTVAPLRDKAKKYVTANCVDTLAKLHSRTKYSEQENKSLRHINEADSEFAIQSLILSMQELGYTYL